MYRSLSEAEQARVRDYVQIFVAEKHWEGCGGLKITDEVCVTIAAQVAVLVLGLKDEYFDRVLSILVYPTAYVTPDRTITRAGVVLEGESALEGEAWYRGPIILSWADTLAGSRDESDGDNLVLHEFAHQLDMLNSDVADGVPPIESDSESQRWVEVMQREHRRLIRDCEQRHRTVLDCYGTTHLSELFAVATEAFFERPIRLQNQHPDLYQILAQYYGQDPASRSA
jgi:Mlc titration factor MtfA (ptsG expression regulator)